MIIISDDGNQGLESTFCTGTRKSGYIQQIYVQLLLYLACETFTACDNVLQQLITKSHTHSHTKLTPHIHTLIHTHTYHHQWFRLLLVLCQNTRAYGNLVFSGIILKKLTIIKMSWDWIKFEIQKYHH